MSDFIVFNTIAKAEHYCKAMTIGHQYECGGDCCWSNNSYFVKDNKVMWLSEGSHRDSYSGSTTVVGRVKKKKP